MREDENFDIITPYDTSDRKLIDYAKAYLGFYSKIDLSNNKCYLINSLGKYDLTVVNYPNGDSLGHTGIYDKVIEGVEELDKCLGKLIQNIDLDKFDVIITADHGNCENMIDPDGTPNKKHSTNVVPFILLNKNYKIDENHIGKLADIAPTILKIMHLDIPKEMTGDVLVK